MDSKKKDREKVFMLYAIALAAVTLAAMALWFIWALFGWPWPPGKG